MSRQQAPVVITFVVCAVMAPLVALALGTGPQAGAPDAQAPTAIELALSQHRCNVADTLSAATDAQQECLDAQLVALRGDFGRDLSRLSGSDRRSVDAACSRLRPAEQHEAYVGCLSDQLAAVHKRQARGEAIISNGAVPLEPDMTPVPLAPASSNRSVMVIGGTVALSVAAIGAVLFASKSRRVRRKCRVCAVDVLDADLCPACRHNAAQALRRAARDRAHSQTAREEEEARREHAHAVEEARVPAPPLARQQLPSDMHQSAAPVVAIKPVVEDKNVLEDRREEGEAAGVFDPYVVLGVSPHAGEDDVRSAYEQAKTRYEPDLVSFLGDEARAHFEAKAQSVERAYQMLMGAGALPGS